MLTVVKRNCTVELSFIMAKSGEEKQPIAYADVVNSKKILLWIRKLSTV